MADKRWRITTEDIATGQTKVRLLKEGDYCIVTTGACYVRFTEAPSEETHIVTLKRVGIKAARS